MTIHPMSLHGAWTRGWVLDWHMASSEFLGYDEHGHLQFNNVRSPLGEALYQLKYRRQATQGQVADAMAGFVGERIETLAKIDMVIPVPPSTPRSVQPVEVLAAEVGRRLGKRAYSDVVRKIRETPAMKNTHDPEERREALAGAFEADAARVRGRGVLLIDDLYRSGGTANAVTVALVAAGASRVYFLAATRTRSNT